MDARLQQLPILAEDGERLLVIGVDDLDRARERDQREQDRQHPDAEEEILAQHDDADEQRHG
ncbi:hypothetical protein [Halorubrum tibetense]|uniref:Uncharacterized protein n=1 Tax=Halorubrum tibetense TaxID=175631 RepID=A0ABD5S9D8_9EURY